MSESLKNAFVDLLEEKKLGFAGLYLYLGTIGIALAIDGLTGWRDEWRQRTDLGRLGLVASSPFEVALSIALLGISIVSLVFAAVLLLPHLAYRAYRAYRQRAYRTEVRDTR